MTRADRKAIKQEAHARARMAYAAAAKLTPRRGLSFKVARLLLTLTTPQIAALAGWKKARLRARSPLSGDKRP